MNKTWKIKCSNCGKVFDNEYPIPDNIPDSEIKCEQCQFKETNDESFRTEKI